MKHYTEEKHFYENSDQKVYEATIISGRSSNDKDYEMAMLSLELIVMEKMKKMCKVYLSGIHKMGLSYCENVKENYIQLAVVIGNAYYEKTDYEREIGITNLLKILIGYDKNWCLERSFLNSTMFYAIYYPTQQRYAINISNGFKVQQSKILRYLFTIQPEAIALFHFLRIWLLEKNYCDVKLIHLALLVIFYLQEKRYMPSIFEIQQDAAPEYIGRWQVQVPDNKICNLHCYKKIKSMKYYKDHIASFFKFYSVFDFENRIMSIYEGKDISVSKYSYNYNGRNVMNTVLFDLEQNSSANVKYNDFNDFLKICDHSYKIFRQFLFEK